MSNIEKIRQEIERLKKYSKSSKKEWIDEGHNQNAFAEDCRIKSFDKLLAFIDSLPEEKTSEDLEEAAARYERENRQSVLSSVDIVNAFIAGAEWQKAKDDEETADLMTIVALDAGQRAREELLKEMPMPEDTVIFMNGVEEGRRLENDDLALTWQDMAKIDAIILDVNNEFAVDYSKEIDRQKFYEEVLKRFKQLRDES